MKRCPHCNRMYSDGVQVCGACGTDLSGAAKPVQPQNAPNNMVEEQPKENYMVHKQVVAPIVQTNATDDSGSIGWGILGALCPVAGWVLGGVWKNTKPKSAKIANAGAWVGFILGILCLL